MFETGVRPAGILVTDFDGTITLYDFYDLVCREFPDIADAHWQRYEAGEISHFEALRLIFAGIRGPESRLLGLIGQTAIDPDLRSSVALARTNGWQVEVASAGCSWYIDKILAASGVELPVHANPGEYSPHNGLMIRMPETSLFVSPELGINKAGVVRAALGRSGRVAFAGDGRADLAPALLVPPQRRFAKHWLARKLHAINEDFIPFECWSDVVRELARREGWSS